MGALFDDSVRDFIVGTARYWQINGVIKTNSFGVVVGSWTNDGEFDEAFAYRHDLDSAEHDGRWYYDNADGKATISANTLLDSLDAARLHPGLFLVLQGGYPWGGSIIDHTWRMIVAVSGFKEDEDIMFAHAVLNFLKMKANRHGLGVVQAAQKGEGAQRFTQSGSFTLLD